jgi:phosphoribosylamine--glycine ligase
MKVLVIGSGGREEAFVWKFQQEDDVREIIVAPGHEAMTRFSKVTLWPDCLKDPKEMAIMAKEAGVSLVVCGPEDPLTKGISQYFDEVGVPFFGPQKEAAQLEGSKIFSKEFMHEFSIPTAGFQVYENYEEALKGLDKWPMTTGIVIKADGLAGRKGVVVTYDIEEAKNTLYDFMKDPAISVKTDRILFEHILPGDEVSAFAFCNGDEFFFLGMACDHKRVNDNDEGPNTGGMGCFRDLQWPSLSTKEKIINKVLIPTLKGMKERGTPYKGILFMGLMIDSLQDPYVIEYNVRFGDPEAQTLLPLIEGNLSQGLWNLCVHGVLSTPLKLKELSSVHVVMTSGGYPSLGKHPMSLGHPIKIPLSLLNENQTQSSKDEILFMAGVKKGEGSEYINTGGRVLGVTSLALDFEKARDQAYHGINAISFKDAHFRRDIGLRRRGVTIGGRGGE